MKVTGLLVVIFFTSPIFVSAQKNESTMDKLRVTTWWNGPLPKYVSYMKFSKTKIMATIRYEGELGTKTYNPGTYYLSNSIDTIYDASKIGQISNGKYIIGKGSVMEIIKLDNKDFWYKFIYPTNIIGGGPNVVIKWSAVSDKGIPWKEE